MGVNLSKGQRVSLDKSMKYALIGLGWDTNSYDGQAQFDLDASAFVCGSTGKVRNDLDFIFYNNLKSTDGSVIHTGDNRDGEGDGDDEKIIIDFSKVPADVTKIAITVTIDDAVARRQNFGQVSNAFVRVVKIPNVEEGYKDFPSGEELLKFNLGEEFSIETAIVVCEIYKNNGEWKFNAVGAGYQGGLEDLCRQYGVNV